MTRPPFAALLVLAACGQASAGSSAADPSDDAAATVVPAPIRPAPREVADTPSIRVVELAIDGKLFAEERIAMVEAQARDRAKDAAKDARDDAALNAALARHAKMDPVARAAFAHRLRAGLHFSKGNDPAVMRIIAARDPVLIEDPQRNEIVTQADMDAIDTANRYVARLAGTTAPDMTEQPGERAELRRHYAEKAPLRTALTQARERQALLVSTIDSLPADRRAEIARNLRNAGVSSPPLVANAARGAENAFVEAREKGRRMAAARARQGARSRLASSPEYALLQKRLRQHHQMMVHTVRMNGILEADDAVGD